MNVGFVGAGHIARAIAEGWSRPEVVDPPRVTFFDIQADAAAAAAAVSRGGVATSMQGLVASSDLVIVAVRPQHVEAVLTEMASMLGERLLVSVAAGVTLARLRATLPAEASVARVMPNIAAALGLGVFLTVRGTTGNRFAEIDRLFGLCGRVVELDEELFDAATAVAGCMPGMLGAIVAGFALAGERHGLSPGIASELAVHGVHGAAAIIAREGDPAAVVNATATPGGMTAAAIVALEEHEVADGLMRAVSAATARAKELT